jgi:outer membrane lipoprotein SlyB
MSNPCAQVPPAFTPKGGLPRALWIGGGLLGLVTAALAGALITRSMDAPAAAATSADRAASAAEAVVPVRPAATATVHAKTAQPTRKAVTEAPVTETPTAVVCANCGTVESVSAMEQEGQGTGLGAVAGGVVGGLLGNQFGSGKGKTAMTVLGAVGGGVAGHQVEKKARGETAHTVRVRMRDGSVSTFQQAQPFAVGTQVVVDGKTLRMGSDAAGQGTP